MVKGCSHSRFIAVGVEHVPDEIEVDPHSSQLLIGLTQSLEPSLTKFPSNHVGLRLPLIKQADSAFWNRSAQVHQMPHRAPSRDQRCSRATHRVTYNHHVAVTPSKGSAHQIRVDIEGRIPILVRQLWRDHCMARLL
jgi:hypothetical protein